MQGLADFLTIPHKGYEVVYNKIRDRFLNFHNFFKFPKDPLAIQELIESKCSQPVCGVGGGFHASWWKTRFATRVKISLIGSDKGARKN